MDIKFVVLLVIAVAIVFLLVSEINATNTHIDKKFGEFESILDKQAEDLKLIMKKDLSANSTKFKTYTNEMLQQIRIMNAIETQPVIMSDHFIEAESIEQSDNQDIINTNQKSDKINNSTEKNQNLHNIKQHTHMNIPYLSEVNQSQIHNNDKKIIDTKESSMYMSELDKSDINKFKVKDEKNNILNSTKMSDKQKISESNIKKITTKLPFISENKKTILANNDSAIHQTKKVLSDHSSQLKESHKDLNKDLNKDLKPSQEDDEKIEDIKNIEDKTEDLDESNDQSNDTSGDSDDSDDTSDDDSDDDSDDTSDAEEDEEVENEAETEAEEEVEAEEETETEDADNQAEDADNADNAVEEEDNTENEADKVDTVDKKANKQSNKQANKQSNKQENKQENKQANKQANKQLNKQANKQSNESDSSNNSSNSKKKINMNLNNKKLQQLRKIQEDMSEDNDVSSQEITFGSKKKGTGIVVKSGKKSSTIVDDLSMGTTGTADESKSLRLKGVSSYTKQQLEDLAKNNNIDISDKNTKNEIYQTIKNNLK